MMKFNFLNLPSSVSGGERRHVPFRSIIHKPFSIIFVLVFVFSIMFSYVYPMSALADPVFQPVYDTQFYQLPQFVDPLNSTQQDIFYFVLGSQVVEYAGLSDYQIENPYSDPSSVGEWFKKIGIDLYNDVLESFAIAGAPVIAGAKWVKDLYANIAGAANFAGAFNNTSWNDWFSDVQTNGLQLQLYPSMFGALNQYFAYNNGLYDWQYNENDWVSDVSRYITLPGVPSSTELVYFNYINEFPPSVRVLGDIQYGPNVGNARVSNQYVNQFFDKYCYLFANTSNNTVYLVDSNGNSPFNQYFTGRFAFISFDPNTNNYSVTQITRSLGDGYYQYSYSGSPKDAVSYLYSQPDDITSATFRYFALSDWIQQVYYGSSWSGKQVLTNYTDLNFDQNINQDTLAPIIETLLDIKGLINDILEQNELKQPALDNITDLQGNPLTANQLQPVSVAVELPDSGITINAGLFDSLTHDGGYISYLWFMTKPLIQYTSSFLDTLIFTGDPNGNFDQVGPGIIVFGVISLGLIGGLVVKCLL